MPVQHEQKEFGIYHWDTFDNETFLIAQADTQEEAQALVEELYKGRLKSSGADRVDIVTRSGDVVAAFSVG